MGVKLSLTATFVIGCIGAIEAGTTWLSTKVEEEALLMGPVVAVAIGTAGAVLPG
jgi:hypothetical protein